MCRSIKTLANFEPPATDDEIRAAAVQFVRKLSGFTRPCKANEDAFNRAVDGVTHIAQELLNSLVTNAVPRDREVQRCGTVNNTEMQVQGYEVHYLYDGREYTTRLPYDPGSRVRVNVDVHPENR